MGLLVNEHMSDDTAKVLLDMKNEKVPLSPSERSASLAIASIRACSWFCI